MSGGTLPEEELGWEGRAVTTEHSTLITEVTGEEQQHEASLKIESGFRIMVCISRTF